MVSRSSDPATVGEMEARFTEVVDMMNLRTGQLQAKFIEVDSIHGRHEQMLQVLESATNARLSSIEDHLEEAMDHSKQNDGKVDWLNSKVIAMECGL